MRITFTLAIALAFDFALGQTPTPPAGITPKTNNTREQALEYMAETIQAINFREDFVQLSVQNIVPRPKNGDDRDHMGVMLREYLSLNYDTKRKLYALHDFVVDLELETVEEEEDADDGE